MELDNLIRVMTFNIRYKNNKDNENGWYYRKEKVASMLLFHKPDLTGLQEALHEQVIFLDKSLSGIYGWIGAGREDGKEKGEYCPVLFRKDIFSVVSHKIYWLSETPEICGSIGWDAMLPRMVIHVVFRCLRNGQILHFFNTHFDHKGAIAKRNSAMLLKKMAKECALHSPVVITGDFNSTEGSEAYQILTQPENGYKIVEDAMYASAWGHHGPTTTCHDFGKKEKCERIDYIFVNQTVRVWQHGVLADHWDGMYPSDHMPVVADISLN